MRIVGPNCMGVMNPRLGLFGTFMSALDEVELPPGNVALISQSGAFGTHAALLLRHRGLDLSLWCTTGNECDVDVADGIACAARDEDTEVIVAYLEGCRDLEKLEAALSVASETRKPIVAFKTGQSDVGAAAARAHTAADAGDDARFSEMFERSGVYRARTIEELIDVAGACAANAFPNGRRAGLMTISGGVGVVMADAAVRAGLDVAPMPVPVERELKALLPFASARNPIDCTAQAFNDWSLFDRFLDAVVRRGGYDSIVLFLATVGANPAVIGPAHGPAGGDPGRASRPGDGGEPHHRRRTAAAPRADRVPRLRGSDPRGQHGRRPRPHRRPPVPPPVRRDPGRRGVGRDGDGLGPGAVGGARGTRERLEEIIPPSGSENFGVQFRRRQARSKESFRRSSLSSDLKGGRER